ncbi:hypothetical protein Micbo1qcDRAFT_169899, partial [Microdochium bolleyi]
MGNLWLEGNNLTSHICEFQSASGKKRRGEGKGERRGENAQRAEQMDRDRRGQGRNVGIGAGQRRMKNRTITSPSG